MPPNARSSLNLASSDQSQQDGRPAMAFMPNSDNQTIRDLNVRSAGGDHTDNSSTTRIGSVSHIFNITVQGNALTSPEPILRDRRRLGSQLSQTEPNGTIYPGFSLLYVFRAISSTLSSVIGGQRLPCDEAATAPVLDDTPGSPVRAIDFKDINISLQASSTASTPTPAQIYVCKLLCSGYGLPCWDTRPRQRELQPDGVVPGDVGIYTVDRGFRKIFNLWDAEVVKEIAASHCNVVPLARTPVVEPDELPQGMIILSSGATCDSELPQNEHGVVHDICFGPSAGGILAAISAADLVTTNDKEAMEEYIIQHAESIFRFANKRHRLKQGDSLYFITGSIKTDASARAAYQASTDQARRLQLSRNPSSTYHWNRLPAARYPRFDSSGDPRLKNQTLFIQGFKLAVSSEFFQRMSSTPAVPASDRSRPGSGGPESQDRRGGAPAPDNNSESSMQRGNGEGSSSNDTSHPSDAGNTQPGGKERPLEESASARVMQEGADLVGNIILECSQFPPSSEVNAYHPSDVINELLLKTTDADFALSHDDDWRHDFRVYSTLDPKDSPEIRTECPNSSGTEGSSQLELPSVEGGSLLSIVVRNGVAYPLTHRDKVRSCFPQPGSTGVERALAERPSGPLEGFDDPTRKPLQAIHDGAVQAQAAGHSPSSTPPKPPSLLDLPNEILSDIILPLPAQDILCSQAVCSRFNSLITSSVETLYRVTLETSGLVDNKGCSSLSASEKLSKLLEGQAAWARSKAQYMVPVIVPGQRRVICLDSQGVIFTSNPNSAFRVVYAILPKRKEEGVTWKCIVFQDDVECVGVGSSSAEHNLVAILTKKRLGNTGTFEFSLHLRELTTGQPHPEVEQPEVFVCNGDDEPLYSSIGIAGDNLSLRLAFPRGQDGTPDQTIVFEWRTGVPKASFVEPGGTYTGSTFLEENVLLLANVMDGTLEIWDLPQTALASCPAALLYILGLPPLVPGSDYTNIRCHAGTGPRSIHAERTFPHQRPYQCNEEESILTFDVLVQRWGALSHNYTFYVHRKSILRIGARYRQAQDLPSQDGGNIGSEPPLPIPWDEWGPGVTRWVDMESMAAGSAFRSAGQRSAFIASNAWNSPSPIIIMDFNPWAVKKCRYELAQKQLALKGQGSSNHKQKQKSGLTTGVGESLTGSGLEQSVPPASQPTQGLSWTLPDAEIIDSAGRYFLKPVRSELPCVRYSSLEHFAYDKVLIDEERILGITAWHYSGVVERFDVHYFG